MAAVSEALHGPVKLPIEVINFCARDATIFEVNLHLVDALEVRGLLKSSSDCIVGINMLRRILCVNTLTTSSESEVLRMLRSKALPIQCLGVAS